MGLLLLTLFAACDAEDSSSTTAEPGDELSVDEALFGSFLEADEALVSTWHKRYALTGRHIVRGKILGADGTIREVVLDAEDGQPVALEDVRAEFADAWSSSYRTLTPSDLGTVASFYAGRTRRVPVVLAWDQCPGWSVTDPELNVDFDMVVQGLGSNPARYFNLSSVANYEVVEFVAPASGTYQVKLSAPRWATCAAEGGRQRARAAVAWTSEHTLFFQPAVLQLD